MADTLVEMLGGPVRAGLLVVVVLVLAFLLVRARRPRPRRWTPGAPRAGEIWFAEVPFDDGTGSKDRPVLLLGIQGRSCEVARLTSQNRDGRLDHVRLPPGLPGVARTSWIDLRPRTLPVAALRRRTGAPGEALVAWYDDARGSAGPGRGRTAS